MNSPTSNSVSLEMEEGNLNSDSSKKSKDRMSEDRKKRKKSSGVNTQDDTDAKGESEEAFIPGQHPG